MKPSRFIFNSDYATLKNDAEGVAFLTIPNLVNIPDGGADVVYTATLQIGASPSAGLRSFVTSDKYTYALSGPSFSIACKQDGFDAECFCDITRNSNGNIEMRVTFVAPQGADTQYTGMGQTLTLHAKTFLSPFDL